MPRGRDRDRDFVEEYALAVGQRIRARRAELDLNQWDLAERIGVHQGVISKWENGAHLPRDFWRARLAHELEMEFAELFPPMEPVSAA